MYSQETIEDIRVRNDIVDVISSYVSLRQKGSILFGLCPFHNEKTPSFSVTPDRQMYHCFGCGASGNVFTFVMQKESLSFPDAVQFLADRTGYSLPVDNYSKEIIEQQKVRDLIFEINKISARFFYDNLSSTDGTYALEYMDNRKITANSRRKFGLGVSSKERNGLYNFLLKKGFTVDQILKSGLALSNKHGGYYDRFFLRLMFPIFEVTGRIVGFGGRILGEGEPKYLNSSETSVFNKSKNLYGINFARLSKTKEFILVEGYMDVISLHQSGFKNAIAALGTSFNKEHARLLKRYAESVIILFDSDNAGVKACLRAIPILTAEGIKVKVLTLENAKDPDEYINTYGTQAFVNQLENAENHLLYQVKSEQKKYNLEDIDEKVSFTKVVSNLVGNLDSPVEREAYSDIISKMTHIDREAIKLEIDKAAGKPLQFSDFGQKNNLKYMQQHKMKERGVMESKKNLILLLSSNPQIIPKIKQSLNVDEFLDPVYEKLVLFLYEYKGVDPLIPAEIINHFETVEEQNKVSSVFTTIKVSYEKENIEKAVNDMIKIIKLNYVNQRFSIENDITEIQRLVEMKRNIEKLYITI